MKIYFNATIKTYHHVGNITDGPDKITLVPATINHTVVEGHILQNILCSTECWPKCTQFWTNVSSSHTIGSGGNLSLGTSSRYFTGKYACTSTNLSPEVHTNKTKSIDVTVFCK